MTLVTVVPWVAGGALVTGLLLLTLRDGRAAAIPWTLPAGLSAAFLAWSLLAVGVEGPLGFWTEHTRNIWGNQIWCDLLLAAGSAWVLVLPRARAVGMAPLPWLLLVFGTGSIGLLAMLARLFQLEARRPA